MRVRIPTGEIEEPVSKEDIEHLRREIERVVKDQICCQMLKSPL